MNSVDCGNDCSCTSFSVTIGKQVLLKLGYEINFCGEFSCYFNSAFIIRCVHLYLNERHVNRKKKTFKIDISVYHKLNITTKFQHAMDAHKEKFTLARLAISYEFILATAILHSPARCIMWIYFPNFTLTRLASGC